jgi:hypothetical protein
VIATANYISYLEYYFRHPSMRENLDDIPAMASFYYRHFHYSWFVPITLLGWAAFLTLRKRTSAPSLVTFLSFAVLSTTVVAMIALLALYTTNQVFVFKFQHLE